MSATPEAKPAAAADGYLLKNAVKLLGLDA
jgi:hypothetical protein